MISPVVRKKSKNLHLLIAGWYRKHRRDLQWRHTTDPYEILISEIMLQQTQVNRVKEKLPLFLTRFPSFRTLAKASKAEVLHAWRGMGYNNRAVRIRDLARVITSRHRGTLPRDISALLELPGIGPYTAHALACFAFHHRVPVVDVNIQRVLSRIFWKMNSVGQYHAEKDIWKLASEILPKNASLWNQALMDLGSIICTARNPLCMSCPVRQYCKSNQLHRAHHYATKRQPRSEPLYEGIPRRIWRGKIIEALRNVNGKGKISLPSLGRTIKLDFSSKELLWLEGLIDRLQNDGLLTTYRISTTTYVSLSNA